ncbi:hypothetical protein VTJ04DRAFT_3713 [Mycothermus thermophilus]|uniref:uncharacterized protein n=1 Tax=Humicola insolens TaxID=85995 RepID=UPI0037426C89
MRDVLDTKTKLYLTLPLRYQPSTIISCLLPFIPYHAREKKTRDIHPSIHLLHISIHPTNQGRASSNPASRGMYLGVGRQACKQVSTPTSPPSPFLSTFSLPVTNQPTKQP